MAPRARQSTAGPTQRRSGNELPTYEKPQFSPSPAAQRALAQLRQSHNLKRLESDLQEAQVTLTLSATEINDRLFEKNKAIKKRKDVQSSQDVEGSTQNDELEKDLENLRDRVKRMTERMEESMRRTIDGRHSAESILKALDSTATNARLNASTQASTQNIRSQTQRRRGRTSTLDDDDDDDDDEEAEDEYQDFTPTDPAGGTQARPSPLESFRSNVDDAKMRYQSYSYRQRYADNNDYRSFRSVVHDAKYRDEGVPLPHHSEWFTEDNAPAPGVTTRARNTDGEEDDDIAVSKATVSTKCPLTMAEFKKPLTSKKCPHSFEADAIQSMISMSTNRVDSRPNGARFVQCPVTGCSHTLTKDDLHVDDVLVRKIQRLQRSRELEDEDMDDDGPSATARRNQTVIEDDDVADIDDIVEGRVPGTQVKPELRASGREPSTARRAPPSSTAVVNLDEDSSDDEAEEGDSMEE